MPRNIVQVEISRWRSIRERKSPRTTVPAAGGAEGDATAGVAGAASGCGIAAIEAADSGFARWGAAVVSTAHFISARRSCGGATIGSGGYSVSPLLESLPVWLAWRSVAPSPAEITISFHP